MSAVNQPRRIPGGFTGPRHNPFSAVALRRPLPVWRVCVCGISFNANQRSACSELCELETARLKADVSSGTDQERSSNAG